VFVNPGVDPSAVPRAGGPQGLAGQASPPPPQSADTAILNGTVHELDDGGAEIELADPFAGVTPEDVPHSGNLAEVLPSSVLSSLAMDLLEGVDADIESNTEWQDQVRDGLKYLGLRPGEKIDKPYEGAPAAYHSVLKEAVIRFAATASGELLPADGPVRCRIFGDQTPQLQAAADRKQNYLNYFLIEEDADYYDDFDQMVMFTGLYGSMFRHISRDPTRGGAPTSRFLTPFDLVTAHHATSLNGAHRVTHIETMASSEIARLKKQAWYADVDLADPTDDTTVSQEIRDSSDMRSSSGRPEDTDHVVYHVYTMLDLPGLEHKLDDEPSGLALPYVVTIHRESMQILRIARNWKDGDPEYKSLEHFVHYKYMQGLGFLGWGFIHLIGADADILTILQRQALASFSFASFPGFLKSRVTTAENTDIRIAPGEAADIDTGGLPIGQAVMPLPYRDMPPSYVPISSAILSGAQRVASTGDMAAGDANENAAPGTVVALIKRQTVLESSVIRRMRRSQMRELRLLADLIGQDGRKAYPFTMNGQQGQALAADFADNSNVTPVSDPNIPTQTERLQMAQAVMTMAAQSGGTIDMKAAEAEMLRAMGKSDADIALLMPPPQPPPMGQPADPVTEFQMAMHGAPLNAAPQQDHAAHIQCHVGQLAVPGVQHSPAGPALMAHIADHTAKFYAVQAQTATGMPMPAPGAPPNPQQDAQIAQAVAAASEKLRQMMAQLTVPGAPGAGGQPDPSATLKAQTDAMQVQQAEADSQRKAVAQARQDQGELIKLQATLKDNEAQRQSDEKRAMIDLEREKIESHTEIMTHQLQAARGLGDQ
jgi:hypothetical protein